MNQPQISEKTPSERLKDLEEYLDLFQTKGWQKYIKEKKEVLEDYQKNAHNIAPDNDTWQRLRGHIIEMESLIAFENYVDMSIELIKEEELDGETED